MTKEYDSVIRKPCESKEPVKYKLEEWFNKNKKLFSRNIGDRREHIVDQDKEEQE